MLSSHGQLRNEGTRSSEIEESKKADQGEVLGGMVKGSFGRRVSLI